MSDPAFVSSFEGGQSAATTNHNITLPATVDVGQRLVVFVTFPLAPTVTVLTAGWTAIHAPAVEDDGQVTLCALTKIAADSDVGATLQLQTGASCKSTFVGFVLNNASAIEGGVARGNQATNNAPNPPSLTLSGAAAPTLWLIAVGCREGQSGDISDVSGPTNYNSSRRWHQNGTGGNGTATGASYRTTLTTATTEDPGAWGLSTARRTIVNTYGVRNTLQAVIAPFTANGEQTFAAAVSYQVNAPFTATSEQTFAANLTYDQTIEAPFTAAFEQTFAASVVTAEIGAPFTPSDEQSFGAVIVVGDAVITAPFTPSSERTYPVLVTGGARTTPQFTTLSIGPSASALGDLAFYTGVNEGAAFSARWATRGPLGFTDFAPFVAGEYEFDQAMIWMRLDVEEVERIFAITRAKMNVDVPDVIDSQEVEIEAGGQWVNFTRSFYAPPNVVAQVIAASGVTTVPRVTIRDDIETTRCFVTAHFGDDVTDSVAATIKLIATGY